MNTVRRWPDRDERERTLSGFITPKMPTHEQAFCWNHGEMCSFAKEMRGEGVGNCDCGLWSFRLLLSARERAAAKEPGDITFLRAELDELVKLLDGNVVAAERVLLRNHPQARELLGIGGDHA